MSRLPDAAPPVWESQPPPWAPPPRGRVPWPWRIAWGLSWRYGVLGTLAVYSETVAGTPWPVLLAVLGAGAVLGLYRRRWVLARLWRTAVVAGVAVYVAPLLTAYPTILTTSIGALTAAPFLATWRRR